MEQAKTENSVSIFRNLRINAWALPLAFGTSALIKSNGGLDSLGWLLTVPFHDFGHALASWMASRPAFPIGTYVPVVGTQERSVVLFVVLSLGLGYLGLGALRDRKKLKLAVIVGILSFLIKQTWFTPEPVLQVTIAYGGIRGEFVLGMALVCAFYYDISARFHWSFFRFVALFPGAYVFLSAFLTWQKIANSSTGLPLTSAGSGNANIDGDLDRLQQVLGMRPSEIIASFDHLGRICMVTIVAHYLIYLGLGWLSKDRKSERS